MAHIGFVGLRRCANFNVTEQPKRFGSFMTRYRGNLYNYVRQCVLYTCAVCQTESAVTSRVMNDVAVLWQPCCSDRYCDN